MPPPPQPGHDDAVRHKKKRERMSFFRGGRQTPAPRPGDVGRSSSSSSSSQPSEKMGGGSRDHSQQSAGKPPGMMSDRSINKRLRDALGFFQEKIPGIRLRIDPSTKIKLRKTLHPLGATILKLGADFDAQLGIWQFRSSWEDRVIGGTLSVVGRELQIQKTWRFNLDQERLGSREDLVASVRFRAGVDLATRKAFAKVGFRPEKIRPFNVYDGFTVSRRLPLDGKKERIKLELKARLALPEPEIECSTEASKILVGLGDVEVTLDELNLLIDY